MVRLTRGDRRALRHIHPLSHKYDNKPYPEKNIKSERVILKVAPERQRA